MILDLSNRKVDDVTVVDLAGKLNTGTSPDADAYLSDLVTDGAQYVLLNLQDVDYVSSSGLRVVLKTGKRLTAAGGKLVLCGLNRSVGEVFRVSGFSSIFPVCKTEAEALMTF